jgi:hypothetical protein
MHDKKIAEEENLKLTVGSDLFQESGFQCLIIRGVNTYQLMKNLKEKN